MRKVPRMGLAVAALPLLAAAALASFSSSMGPGARMPTGQSQNLAGFLTINGQSIPAISVQGHVRKPGKYAWPAPGHDQTALDAVQTAGGFDEVGNRTEVKVTHLNSDRTTTVWTVNTTAKPPSGKGKAVVVHPGDIVFVPARQTES